MSNMTSRRLRLIRVALCYLETEYDGEYIRTKAEFGLSYDKWNEELEAIHEWINKQQKKRAKA